MAGGADEVVVEAVGVGETETGRAVVVDTVMGSYRKAVGRFGAPAIAGETGVFLSAQHNS
jgi:putative protein kinase ArgK-like GTPase of G3E family